MDVQETRCDNGETDTVFSEVAMEVFMTERLEMECRQELDRVQAMNKVRDMINDPSSLKLARNILTKAVTGPLGEKSTQNKTAPTGQYETKKRRRTSEETRELHYQQRLEHIRKMKKSQNEELAELRSEGIVQKRLADRRMRSRARRMFNHRVYVTPKSKSGVNKSSILVTGESDDTCITKSAELIRQESQIYVNNFIRNPSKSRRVLQRLNSEQIQNIKRSEMKRSHLNRLEAAAQTFKDSSQEETHLMNGSSSVNQPGEFDQVFTVESQKHSVNSTSSSVKPIMAAVFPSKKLTKEDKQRRLSSLGRKIKGGIAKVVKKKSRLKRNPSSSLDELLEDVRVKPRKKSAERQKMSRISSKALEGHFDCVSHTSRKVPLALRSTKRSKNELTSPPGESVNWPSLPSAGSHDPSSKSHDTHTVSPLESHAPMLHEKSFSSAAAGPQFPLKKYLLEDSAQSSIEIESSDILTNGDTGVHKSHMTNGLESFDDHMITPPVELREIEQNDEEGYMSESESGTYSDTEDQLISERPISTKYSRPRVCIDGGRIENEKMGESMSPHSNEAEYSEDGDVVSDLPELNSRQKKSHEDDQPTNFQSWKRHFSSPQVRSPITLCCDHPTPHGYYATVEVNPFSIEFERGAQENLTLMKQESEETGLTTTMSMISRQVSVECVDYGSPGIERTVETYSQVTYSEATRHTCEHGNQMLEPAPLLGIKSEKTVPEHAYRDPMFLEYLDKLDHKPTVNDYITFKLRNIGDQIDQKYDVQLNRALDEMFWNRKTWQHFSELSWESFGSISKRLIMEGQRIQDGIFLVTCFGRRLSEMLPDLGDRVTDFTQMAVDAYASDFLLGIGGWGRLVECYNQVETVVDLDNHTTPYTNLYDDPQPFPPNQSSIDRSTTPPASTQTPSNIIQVNPPLICFHDEPQPLNHLRRVISVEVLFNEEDSTKHAQNGNHDNMKRQPSLTRSLSTNSIDILSSQHQSQFTRNSHLSPNPNKPVQEHFIFEETYMNTSRRYSRRGSAASVCSTGSAIRLVSVDTPCGGLSAANGQPLSHIDAPYLDLNLDTPQPSPSNTIDGRDQTNTTPPDSRHLDSRRDSLTLPLITAATAIGVIGILGYLLFIKGK